MRHVSRSLILASSLLALVLGCTSSGGPLAVTDALTEGRVTSEGGAATDVMVRAYSMRPDGTLEPASEPASTSASGRYALRVTLADDATALVVRTEDGTARMSALGRAAVSSATSFGGAIVLAPVDARSTFEAEVDAALEAATDASIEAQATTDALLASALATRLAARADREATVAATAAAIADARATLVLGLEHDVGGGSAGDLSVALDAFARDEASAAARADAGAPLDVSARLDAVTRGAIDAGYSASTVAAATITAAAALEARLSDRVEAGAAELQLLAAFAVTAAVDATGAIGVEAAGATLRARLVADAAAGASASATAGAWLTYASAVRTAVEAEITAGGTAIAELLVDLAASVDALAAAWSEIGAGATASARIDAYARFHAAVTSTEHVTALVAGGLTEAEARATLDAMAAIGASMR